MLGRQLGDQVGGQRRVVGEGLVEDLDDPRQQLVGVGPDDELVVVGAEALGDQPRAVQLGEAALLEADREGVDRLARRPREASAVSAPESIPPESSTPTGTSATRWARTESASRSRSSSSSAAGALVADLAGGDRRAGARTR